MSGWSLNLQATELVRRHAIDEADKRRLLDMLGLVRPGSRLLTPDDTRNLAVDPSSDDDARAPKGPVHVREPKTSSAPPGLYAVPEPPARRDSPGRPPADRKLPDRKPAARAPREPRTREREKCGTYAGWERHQLEGSEVDAACQDARDKKKAYHRAYDAARRARKKAAAAETPTEKAAASEPLAPPGTAPSADAGVMGERGPTPPQVSPSRATGEDGEPGASDAVAGPPVADDEPVDVEILPCDDCPHGDCFGCDAIVPAPPPPPVVVPVDLDRWIAAAQRNPARSVQRAAAVAITSLLQLRVAMDDLARAERASGRQATR